ncbi:MAG: ABC transporter permease [Rhodocyclales bacterium RIFCSPLOWO2_02_FULL_63_24]|nr:MAG: ABC transporter permease [Rhodocyclales bacterium RIFCSPLOWO2_02_FULL_63_24]
MNPSPLSIHRWTPLSVASVAAVVGAQLLLVAVPLVFGANVVERLTTLCIYGILALMWNSLAGYGGLISVGQQAFFGLGAYAAIRLADAGFPVYPALALGALLVAVAALPMAQAMLRLKGGEFAIGMWVVAEFVHLLVNLDPLIQGETGTSLIALNSFDAEARRSYTYWAALASMAALAWGMFFLLRGRLGTAAQAIRDNEEAAASVGVRVFAAKRTLFLLSAFGCALAGALWVATTISFQPKTYFSVQWSAYMIFMVLVGGIGTFEGPILGAVLFFAVETAFGATGVWYMIGLGATALLFAMLLPQGLWGAIEKRFGLRLLPVGYFLK